MLLFFLMIIIIVIIISITKKADERDYEVFKKKIFEEELGINSLFYNDFIDQSVDIESCQEFEEFDIIKFLKGSKSLIKKADIFKLVKETFDEKMNKKIKKINILQNFLKDNEYNSNSMYIKLRNDINYILT